MSNEKSVVQRPFAVQPSITCCGFSTANGKLWASEPLSSGSVHEILWLWLVTLCLSVHWLPLASTMVGVSKKELNSRDGSTEVLVRWQDGEAPGQGSLPGPTQRADSCGSECSGGFTPQAVPWARLCDRRWPLWEGALCDSNQPFVVVMIRKGPSYFSHFATNTTTIHYFPSVPHPMEESPLPIYIEEGTEVPIGECSWDGICLREGVKGTWVLYSSHLCVPICHWKW